MATIIRRPVVDINGRDFATGEFVGRQDVSKRYKKHMAMTKKRFEEKEKNEKGEIHIEGLGRVKM